VGGIAHDTTQPESPPAKSKAADNNSTLISADVPWFWRAPLAQIWANRQP